jgi:hypothetical protein
MLNEAYEDTDFLRLILFTGKILFRIKGYVDCRRCWICGAEQLFHVGFELHYVFQDMSDTPKLNM